VKDKRLRGYDSETTPKAAAAQVVKSRDNVKETEPHITSPFFKGKGHVDQLEIKIPSAGVVTLHHQGPQLIRLPFYTVNSSLTICHV